ncbi:MAG TPA: SEL1-like repeat protein, partial [Dongiaceae bacterium]|nr:SEL1-like repeat protein [Dongiaceae bacterium]
MRRSALLLATAISVLGLTGPWGAVPPAQADYQAAEQALEAGDFDKAIPLLDEEAKLGNPVAAYNLARIYEQGQAVPADYDKAAAYYRIAAELDTAPRFDGAALGANGPQLIQAAQMYSQYSLGRLYEAGKGVPQDLNQAAEWYVRAADLGHPSAALRLGRLFRDGGPGLKPQGKLAERYFLQAGDQGNAGALNEIGLMYLKGTAVTRNAKTAHDWFEKAAAQGSVEAEYNLGLLFQSGYSGKPDYIQAIEHFKTAANKLDGPSMMALGDLYAEGKGVPQDPVQAYTWYSLAKDHGAAEGAARMAALAPGMTPVQVAQAESAAQGWQPSENGLPVAAASGAPAAEPVMAQQPAASAPDNAPAADNAAAAQPAPA